MSSPERLALAQYPLCMHTFIQYVAGSERQQVRSLAITTRSLDYISSVSLNPRKNRYDPMGVSLARRNIYMPSEIYAKI